MGAGKGSGTGGWGMGSGLGICGSGMPIIRLVILSFNSIKVGKN
jgi:hypothetical protein